MPGILTCNGLSTFGRVAIVPVRRELFGAIGNEKNESFHTVDAISPDLFRANPVITGISRSAPGPEYLSAYGGVISLFGVAISKACLNR